MMNLSQVNLTREPQSNMMNKDGYPHVYSIGPGLILSIVDTIIKNDIEKRQANK